MKDKISLLPDADCHLELLCLKRAQSTLTDSYLVHDGFLVVWSYAVPLTSCGISPCLHWLCCSWTARQDSRSVCWTQDPNWSELVKYCAARGAYRGAGSEALGQLVRNQPSDDSYLPGQDTGD